MIKVALRRAELDCHILTFDIAGLLQAGMKSRDLLAARLHIGNHESDHRHRGLLRARRERPRSCRTADKADKFPPPHWPAHHSDKAIVSGRTGYVRFVPESRHSVAQNECLAEGQKRTSANWAKK